MCLKYVWRGERGLSHKLQRRCEVICEDSYAEPLFDEHYEDELEDLTEHLDDEEEPMSDLVEVLR